MRDNCCWRVQYLAKRCLPSSSVARAEHRANTVSYITHQHTEQLTKCYKSTITPTYSVVSIFLWSSVTPLIFISCNTSILSSVFETEMPGAPGTCMLVSFDDTSILATSSAGFTKSGDKCVLLIFYPRCCASTRRRSGTVSHLIKHPHRQP